MTRAFAFSAVTSLLALAAPLPVMAAGDLLVAPTRIVLDGARGTEVILNNIDDEPATYRISMELRRMNADGSIDEIDPATATEAERKALEIISYGPKRVVLAPNQPQAIRIGVRPPPNLPDGEYRAHMHFRAIPDAKPATAPAGPATGVSIELRPIYGVTIPVIIRKGKLEALAAINNPKIVREGGKATLALTLNRKGTRSTFGRIRALKPGQAEPVFEVRGIAVYPELTDRQVSFSLDAEDVAKLIGPVTIQYLEEPDAGGRVMAEVKTVLR